MSITAEKNIAADIVNSMEETVNHFPPLAAQRQQAAKNFQTLGLPGSKNEEFKHTPLSRLLEKNFNFTAGNPTEKISTLKVFSIEGLEANTVVFINGIFSREHSRIISPASDLSILTMEEALVQKAEVVMQYLSKHIDLKLDALTSWNTAAWKSGLFVHVPENKNIETPIVTYHIHDTSDGQVVTLSRNLFVVGKNSNVTILEKFDSVGDANHFSNMVTEAFIGDNSELNLYSIQNDAGKRYQYGLTQVHQHPSSRVNTFTFSLNGKLIRNNLHLSLDGEGIESHMYGLYLLDGDTLADNHTVVDHKKPNSFSNELYKGIMDGNSKGIFNGKIYVRPQAQKTNAFQANRNILLTDSATVNTKPQLEIWADDVKCSHGCTAGQLDEEALFYLQSRGISKETARAMMLYAFAAELLENVKNPVVKNYLDTVISERLHKNF